MNSEERYAKYFHATLSTNAKQSPALQRYANNAAR